MHQAVLLESPPGATSRRGKGEFRVLSVAPPNNVLHPNIMRDVEERHRGAARAHQAIQAALAARISIKEPVLTKSLKAAPLANQRSVLSPCLNNSRADIVFGIELLTFRLTPLELKPQAFTKGFRVHAQAHLWGEARAALECTTRSTTCGSSKKAGLALRFHKEVVMAISAGGGFVPRACYPCGPAELHPHIAANHPVASPTPNAWWSHKPRRSAPFWVLYRSPLTECGLSTRISALPSQVFLHSDT